MARPTTKSDLINEAKNGYKKLIELIDSIDYEKRILDFNFDISKEKGEHWTRDKNIKDVIIHLYEWQILLLNWVHNNQTGISKQFLIEGYNWKTYGLMNNKLASEHQTTTLNKALMLFKDSNGQVMQLLNSFTNEELFSKNVYPWVGGSTLGSYFVSVTCSHYEWAMKKILKHKKISLA